MHCQILDMYIPRIFLYYINRPQSLSESTPMIFNKENFKIFIKNKIKYFALRLKVLVLLCYKKDGNL